MNVDKEFHVELVDRDLVNVEIVEKELVDLKWNVVDVIRTMVDSLNDLNDVVITDVQNQQVISYNQSTGKWENKTLSETLEQEANYNEQPTKISAKIFQTAQNFVSGTLRVYLNGIKEIYITEIGNNRFSFEIDTVESDEIEVNYVRI